MRFTGKEADVTLARLERFLSIALIPGLGATVFGIGLTLVLTGICLWLVLSGWVSLMGANMIYMGIILSLLGLEVKSMPERLSLTPLLGLLGWFWIRRVVSFTLIMEERESIASMGRLGSLDYLICCSRAELIGALGVFGFWCGWRFARQERDFRGKVEPLVLSMDRSLWSAYAIGVLLYILIINVPVLGRLGSFGAALCTIPHGVAFCVVVLSTSSGSLITMGKSIAMMMPFSMHVMGEGMKSSFLQPFLPAFHGLVVKNLRTSMICATLALCFLLLFVFPYISIYRVEIWGAGRDISEKTLAREAWGKVQEGGYAEVMKNSFDDFQSRYSSIGTPGWIVDIVHDEGHAGGIFLKNISYAFIPRLLWPNKPKFEAAGWLTKKLGGSVEGLEYEDFITGENVSSTAFHLPMEWYWMFGWPGSFLGLAFLGYAYAWIHRYLLLNSLRSPVFLAGWYLFFSFVCELEETRSTTTFQRPVVVIAAIWTMYGLTRMIPNSKKNMPVYVLPAGSPTLRP